MLARIIIALSAMILSACSQVSPQLQKDISTLRADLSLAKAEIGDLRAELTASRFGKVAVMDLEDKAYSRLNTEMGVILISVEKVESHLDGVRVSLRIGNPHNVVLQGFKAKVRWGARLPPMDDGDFATKMDAWKATIQEKEISSPDALYAGSWNLVQVTVAPAKQEQFGYLSVTEMEFDTLRLQ